MGLGHRTGRFIYGEVYDWGLDVTGAIVFPDRVAFIVWLAIQGDESLSGRERDDGWYPNNQRITRARLEKVLRTRSGHAQPDTAADGGV